MKINVGSTNKGKIEAVNRACQVYDLLNNAELEGVSVVSGVNDQPIGLEMTIQGAMNRAKAAYEYSTCDLSFGLESGIFPAPLTKSDYFDTCACAIFDGQKFHIGLSSCFEYPQKMIELILSEDIEVTSAALAMGFSHDEKFRENQGMIGVLTKGRLTRIDYTFQAVQTAMIHLENAEHYPAKN